MSKKLAVKQNETKALAVAQQSQSWGTEGLDTSDILIPKLLLMQALSDAVNEDKAQAGDIIKSTTGEVLGGRNKPVQFIPLLSFKTWILNEEVAGKFEYRGTEEMNAQNSDAALEWDQNGTKWRRDRSLNFYVLLPADIEKEMKAFDAIALGEMPDTDDALLPAVLSFRRTSYQAGKELVTHFAKAQHFGLPPAVSTFQLKSEKISNDKGHFFVMNLEKSGKTPPEFMDTCKRWYETLTKTKLKVDNSDLSPVVSEVDVVPPVVEF